jgi:SAM-dependent methyltransferase
MSESGEEYFATRLPQDMRRERVWHHLTRYLQQYVPPGAAVLELGAGYCDFINRVGAGRRVAVDRSPSIQQRIGEGVEGISADALHYLREAEPEQFDFILASNFFEHFEWAALSEMIALIRRILRPSGRLAVLQPNFRLTPGRYFDDYTHRAIFTDVSLADWLRSAGFEIVTLVPRFLPLTIQSRAGGLAWLIPLYLRLPYRPLAGQMLAIARRPATGNSR